MAKGGGGGDDFDWQGAALNELSVAANTPGHLNININIDYTPTGNEGDLAGLVAIISELMGG